MSPSPIPAVPSPPQGPDEPLPSGPGSWPDTTSSYALEAASGAVGAAEVARVTVTVGPRPTAAVPGPGDARATAATSARVHAAEFRAVHEALGRTDVAAVLLTTLHQDAAGAPVPVPLAGGQGSLARFAVAARAFADAAATLVDPALEGVSTVGGVQERFGLDATTLGAANADRPFAGLAAAGQAVIVPAQPEASEDDATVAPTLPEDAAAVAEGGTTAPKDETAVPADVPEDVPTVPDDGTTLAAFAAAHGATPAAVLAANPALRLASPPELVLPGLAALPTPPPLVPAYVAPDETLADLAQRFATTPEALVADNPELAAKDPAAQDAPSPLPSPSPLPTDAVVLVPAPRVAPEDAPTARTLGDAARAHGIAPLPLAAANAALVGLLTPGVQLLAPVGAAGTVAPETTGEQDSLNAVLGRFAARGVAVDLEGLVAANAATALLRPDARLLLPPREVAVTGALAPRAEPFPVPAFPIAVAVRMTTTAIPAPAASPEGWLDRIPRAARPLEALAAAVETSFPGLRVAGSETADDAPWAVALGPDGVQAVAVGAAKDETAAPPRVLAIRPLYPAAQDFAVDVPTLDDDGGIRPGEARTTSYAGVDVDALAVGFLEDLDRWTGPVHTAAIADHAAPALDALLTARGTLRRAVAAGLAPVLQRSDPAAADGRTAAAAELGRATDVPLAERFGTAAVVQYDATVTLAPATGGTARARLVVRARPDDGSLAASAPYALGLAPLPIAAGPTHLSFALSTPRGSSAPRVLLPASRVAYEAVLVAEDDAAGAVESDKGDAFARDGRGGAAERLHPLVGSPPPEPLRPALPASVIPLPRRGAPPRPLAPEQEARATYTGAAPPTLADVVRWTYAVTVDQPVDPRDELLLSVAFDGVAAAPSGSRPEEGLVSTAGVVEPGAPATTATDLAVALARYASLAPELRTLMAWYVDPPTPAPANLEAVRSAVAGTAARLAADVATAWSAHTADAVAIRTPVPPPASPAQAPAAAPAAPAAPAAVLPTGAPAPVRSAGTFAFRLAVEDTPDASGLTAVVLTLDGGTHPGPTDVWPRVQLLLDQDRDDIALGASPEGTSCRYAVTDPVAGTGVRGLRLSWDDLDVTTVADARASLELRCNTTLAPGVETTPAFRPDPTRSAARDAAVPSLRWADGLPLAGATFAAALEAALTQLLDPGAGEGLALEIALGYAYEPAPGAPVTVLPVALRPPGAATPAVAAELADAAASWLAATAPDTTGAVWTVALTVLRTTGDDAPRPVLVLDQLTYPVGA